MYWICFPIFWCWFALGHPLGYIAMIFMHDIKDIKEFNVLHPMGNDSLDFPAEQIRHSDRAASCKILRKLILKEE